MSVNYVSPLATSSGLWGRFIWLLLRWRGSVYKLIWREYLFFLAGYTFVSVVYRFGLTDIQQKAFEKMIEASQTSLNHMEITFVLGFFVTSIVGNWWTLYKLIPWPDHVALLRKYPTLQDLVSAGLLLESERLELERANRQTIHGAEWLPIKWATELVVKAQQEQLILNDYACQRILQELDRYRHDCSLLRDYEALVVPLVYVQVATLCVYLYFGSQLVAGQWMVNRDGKDRRELYFPFMGTIQFIFYMGWLKVAETLINPFGSDDDDFDLETIMERNIQVSNMMINATRETNTTIPDCNGNVGVKESCVPLSPVMVTSWNDKKKIDSKSTRADRMADSILVSLTQLGSRGFNEQRLSRSAVSNLRW